MSDNKIQRLRYYKGQVLTAQDFEDQQNYHIEKLQRHVQRFLFGVIRGLNVMSNGNGFSILEGVAVDKDGREIFIAEPINFADPFDPAKPYLSISYHEEESCAGHSICDSNAKKNRIVEGVEVRWDELPDPTGERITLAYITQAENSNGLYEIKTEGLDNEGRRIRIHANLISEDDVLFKQAYGHDHSGRDDITGIDHGTQIPTQGIADEAITSGKIAPVGSIPNVECGIAERHIQEGAVTKGKIDPDLKWDFIDPAGGDLTGEYPNPKIAYAGKNANNEDCGITSAHIRTADNSDVNDPLVGDGIKTAHIHQAAVTSSKIKNADGTEDTSTDNGIKTGHIQPGAITSSKIRNADGTLDNSIDNGIKAAHIHNGAITSSKIKLANGDTLVSNETGIKSGHIRPADNSDVTRHNEGDGIKTAHIHNGSITSAKIKNADGTLDTSNDSGIKTNHIQTGAIISSKIRNADGSEDTSTENGIKTKHIQTGAITSSKIRNADGSEDTSTENGIKTKHIQTGAITSSKIRNADGSEDNSIDYGIKAEHIQDGAIKEDKLDSYAVSSAKIKEADGTTEQDITKGYGIKTSHIQNEAVTQNKLDFTLRDISPETTRVEGESTVNLSLINEFEFNPDKLLIGYVLPETAGGKLSWKMGIIKDVDKGYRLWFEITNLSSDPVDFKIRLFTFN